MSRQLQLVKRIGRLSPRKQLLLQARLNGGQRNINQSDRLALAAFVTPAPNQVLSLEQLRESLRRSLPDYMVPASFIVLDELPLLPNGKVDVAALSISKNTAIQQRAVRSITGETENKLIDILCAVLKTDCIDVEDSFFDIGGDSLLGMMVVSRAHQEGLALKISDLFENPTIGQLAVQLREREAEVGHTQL